MMEHKECLNMGSGKSSASTDPKIAGSSVHSPMGELKTEGTSANMEKIVADKMRGIEVGSPVRRTLKPKMMNAD